MEEPMLKALRMRPLTLPFAIFTLGAVPASALPQPQSSPDEAPQIRISLSDGQAATRPQPPQLEEDEAIAVAIETELMSDPTIPFDAIDVKVNEGVVHLDGEVSAIMKKERAVMIAESVRGVDAILDRIVVKPDGELTDEVIAANIRTAFLFDPATESFEIIVRCKEGAVTLEGSVDSWAERRLARRVAGHVRGVRSIENKIRVRPASKRVDSDIKHDIVETLRWDELVDHPLVRVEVDEGLVTLSGAVGSVAEKRRTEAAAWVSGVKNVDSEQLAIESYAADPDQRHVETPPFEPSEVKAAMKRAFAQSPRLSGRQITVHLDGHHAVLRGTVESLREKRAAGSIALHTVGVWSLSNHLRVRPAIVADATIKERLKERIQMDPLIFNAEIEPVVQQGIVRLRGRVENAAQRRRIHTLAEGLEGVRVVYDRIECEDGTTLSYRPYLDFEAIPMVAPTIFTDAMPLDDASLEAAIERRWRWNALLDDRELDVRVDDGVVIISGEVETWAQRNAAERAAWAAGAQNLRNRISFRRKAA
jgi:osmotically-inducible protein OsmY